MLFMAENRDHKHARDSAFQIKARMVGCFLKRSFIIFWQLMVIETRSGGQQIRENIELKIEDVEDVLWLHCLVFHKINEI